MKKEEKSSVFGISLFILILLISGLIFISEEDFSQPKTPDKETQLKEARELLNLSESNINSLINMIEDGAIVNGYMTESEAMNIFKKNLQTIESAKTTIRQLANEGYSMAEIMLTQITLLEVRIEQKKTIFAEDLVLAQHGRIRERDRFGNPIYN